MLRAIFSADFFQDEKNRFARVKTPAELVAGTARLSGDYREPAPAGMERLSAGSPHGPGPAQSPQREGLGRGLSSINTGLPSGSG